MKRVLGLFAKRPAPGAVKTRLAAAVSPEWAAQVQAGFLLDSLERFSSLQVQRVLAYTPDDAGPHFQAITGGRWELTPQGPGDLGKRMAAFCHQCFDAGANAVVLLGCDSPTLPLGLVAQAFAELARADLVLGPAADGGYYLIGCTPPPPEIFAGISWSTSGVLEQTIGRLTARPRRLALLPPWYDVDTIDDWHALRGHVAALRMAGIDPQLPHTEPLLRASPF